ncbi:MAG: imidazole glycerol phosphate synthase subunit HisH [Hyphomicrobiales bacterium]
MKIAIIDYGSGNLASAGKAFERAAREAGLNAEISITSDPDYVANADRIVLPGVGAFADCRKGLDSVDGMLASLNEAVIQKARPFLGICVGHQLMASRGLEKETTNGLDWIKSDVVEIKPSDPTLKIPHMGWNTLDVKFDHPIFDGIETGEKGLHAYFVHSYHMMPTDGDVVLATSNYGGDITAMVAHENRIGTQFHPEKSQTLGLALIANFLKWKI